MMGLFVFLILLVSKMRRQDLNFHRMNKLHALGFAFLVVWQGQ